MLLYFVHSNPVETGYIFDQNHLYDGRTLADSPLNICAKMMSDNLYSRLEKLEVHMNCMKVKNACLVLLFDIQSKEKKPIINLK